MKFQVDQIGRLGYGEQSGQNYTGVRSDFEVKIRYNQS
jgi:hypothetical protein